MLINDASITGSLIVNASASLQNISLGGNIIPDETNLRNLGSTDKYFKEIYVSTGSINFVDGGSVVAVLSAGTITAIQSNTSSANSRLTTLESVSASLQSFTASISTTNTFTSSATARLNALETSSASVDTLNTTQSNRLGSLETISASNISRITALETTSASVDTLNTTQNNRLSALETTSASVDTLNTTQNTRITNLEIKTGSLATTGSNTFIGTQTITGSLYISSDLIVQGSSSLQNITASAVSIGTNLINLNTANPAIRYAGLSIGDSGSIGSSGSFLYDSVQDEMIFIHRGANTTVTSSVVLMGPQTFDNIGSETYPTLNIIQKGTGNEHLVDSCIFDNGTTTCIKNNLVAGVGNFSNCLTFGDWTTAANVLLSNKPNEQGGYIRAAVSTAEYPTYAFEDDRDTGVYRNGANSLGFATSGSARLTISNTGAATFSSTIAGTTIYGSTAVCSPIGLFSGCVGIGTTEPYTKLQVNSGNISVLSSCSIGTDGASDVRRVGFGFKHPDNTVVSALINTSAAGTWGLNLHFNVRGGNAVMPTIPAITIVGADDSGNNGGRVGIGTCTPTDKLHVLGADNGITICSITANRPVLNFINGSTSMLKLSANATYGAIASCTGDLMYFYGSNVGIGTASPSSALHIVSCTIHLKLSYGNDADCRYSFMSHGGVSAFATDGANNWYSISMCGGGTGSNAWGGGIQFLTNNISRGYFAKAGEFVVNKNILVGQEFSASQYLSISENQIYRTGNGTFYLNNSATGDVVINQYGGGTYVNGTNGYGRAVTNSSDERLKKNITSIDNGLEKVLRMNGVYFEFNKQNELNVNVPEGKRIGLIAQEIENVIPEAVFTSINENEPKTVDYMGLSGLIVRAIQEQQCIICSQSQKIALLESCIGIV